MVGPDDRGTTDVFEELPSILIVITATFVFLLTVAEGIISYSFHCEEDRLTQEMQSFFDSILSYEPLLFNSRYGNFYSSKLNEETRERLEEDFNPDKGGFRFNLTIVDVSLYEHKYDWSAGDTYPDTAVRRSASFPIVISNHLNQHHPAILKIVLWSWRE